jgi:hypothetical protein
MINFKHSSETRLHAYTYYNIDGFYKSACVRSKSSYYSNYKLGIKHLIYKYIVKTSYLLSHMPQNNKTPGVGFEPTSPEGHQLTHQILDLEADPC